MHFVDERVKLRTLYTFTLFACCIIAGKERSRTFLLNLLSLNVWFACPITQSVHEPWMFFFAEFCVGEIQTPIIRADRRLYVIVYHFLELTKSWSLFWVCFPAVHHDFSHSVCGVFGFLHTVSVLNFFQKFTANFHSLENVWIVITYYLVRSLKWC